MGCGIKKNTHTKRIRAVPSFCLLTFENCSGSITCLLKARLAVLVRKILEKIYITILCLCAKYFLCGCVCVCGCAQTV